MFFKAHCFSTTDNALIYFIRQVLEDLELLMDFKTILHVPNLTSPIDILTVLEEVDLFSKEELANLHGKLQGRRYFNSNLSNVL